MLSEAEFNEIIDLKKLMGFGFDVTGYFDKTPKQKTEFLKVLYEPAVEEEKQADEGEGVIVDKIPVKDHHGNVQWEVVREKKKEGWESLMYYFFLPMMGLVGVYFTFGSRN